MRRAPPGAGPLPPGSITDLLAWTLRREPASVAPVAALIERKTHGNAFFVRECLKSLADAGHLVPDPAAGGWRWDAAGPRGWPA